MTPLQRAQAFAKDYAPTKAGIVDHLRRQGWTREDANEEADIRERLALEQHEQHLAQFGLPQEGDEE